VSLVGVPGRFVVAWNESRVGGTAATSVLSPPALARLDAQVQQSWPPGPYALGSAASAVACGLLAGSPRRRTVFAVLEGEERRRPVVAAVPVTLDPGGVAVRHLPELSPRERLAFETGLAGR
jgi:malate/lactate dehydrogenase